MWPQQLHTEGGVCNRWSIIIIGNKLSQNRLHLRDQVMLLNLQAYVLILYV